MRHISPMGRSTAHHLATKSVGSFSCAVDVKCDSASFLDQNASHIFRNKATLSTRQVQYSASVTPTDRPGSLGPHT